MLGTSMKICGAIAVFMLLLGTVFCMKEGDWAYMGLMTLCVLIFLGITLVVCWAANRSGAMKWQVYEMDSSSVHIGTGRSSSYYSWKSAQEVVFCRNYFEIKGKIGRGRIYVPAEDMETVREYVRAHIPAGTPVAV